MSTAEASARSPAAGFRARVLLAIMLVVSAVTVLGLYLAQRNLAANVQSEFEVEFRGARATRQAAAATRHAALAERCRALVRKPRIHAALEDNALDLLYPSARDELRDLTENEAGPTVEPATPTLHALFYRFLDGQGKVIHPPEAQDGGALRDSEEAALSLAEVPHQSQTGFLRRTLPGNVDSLTEIMAMPIISSETGEVIAALVLGFAPSDPGSMHASTGVLSGVWLEGRLHLPALTPSAAATGATALAPVIAAPEGRLPLQIEGQPYSLFFNRLNPTSRFSPAFDVTLYPLANWRARQRRLRWKFVAAGAGLFAAAFVASHWISFRLARPVERLAVDSEENRHQRQRAEAALELTSAELQRSARFSANASHQLKTPVSVLRAGLEELLSGEKLGPAMREEIAGLVHQTFRLTSIIEDLLLLSRMDAGRLELELRPVDLAPLIAALLDDLSTLPDPFGLAVATSVPGRLTVAGEPRYTTLIVQNLLENARKYNQPHGQIQIGARREDLYAVLAVGNTGPGIPPTVREHIFERFHRGPVAENVPGHGLGLNLARELARLHGGDLRLTRADEHWTEFEVRFRVVDTAGEHSAAAR